MVTRRNLVSTIAVVGATWALPVKAAQEKDTLPKPPGKLALGDADVRDLLLLMDTDRNGKISKTEWINFMSAEFDRLDTDHNGELDIHEIAQSKLRATRHTSTGK
jgi:EF hand